MMKFIYPSRWANFWDTIREMIEENYYDPFFDEETIFIIGLLESNPAVSCIEFAENYHKTKFKKAVLYQLEPLLETHWRNPNTIVSNLKTIVRDDIEVEIWDYDLDNVEYLKNVGIEAKFRPMKFTRSLRRIKRKENPEIDVLMYMLPTQHRFDVFSSLGRHTPQEDPIRRKALIDMKFVWIHGITGKPLEEYIANSKIILNVNSIPDNQISLQQQTRIFHLLCNDLCVLSQHSRRNYFGKSIQEFESARDVQEKALDILVSESWRLPPNPSWKNNNV